MHKKKGRQLALTAPLNQLQLCYFVDVRGLHLHKLMGKDFDGHFKNNDFYIFFIIEKKFLFSSTK